LDRLAPRAEGVADLALEPLDVVETDLFHDGVLPAERPGRRAGPVLPTRPAGRTEGPLPPWRGAAVSASVAAVMARDTGFAWSARSRAVDVLFHLPSLIRLYWRLFRDPRGFIWPKPLLVGAASARGSSTSTRATRPRRRRSTRARAAGGRSRSPRPLRPGPSPPRSASTTSLRSAADRCRW